MRTAREYDRAMRGLQVYRDEPGKVGLQHLIPWVRGLYASAQHPPPSPPREEDGRRPDPVWVSTHVPWRTLVAGLGEKARRRLRGLLHRDAAGSGDPGRR
jgi:hypothetical protein